VQEIIGDGRDGAERALLGVIGIFFVVAGVMALRNLLVSLAPVATLIGLMWLVGGVMELISAFGAPGGGYRWWHAFVGGLSTV
jgi:membrane protein HdeD